MGVFMGSNHGTSFEGQLDFQAADAKTHGAAKVWAWCSTEIHCKTYMDHKSMLLNSI